MRPTDVRQTLYPLRAVDRVCDIIDLLAEHPSGITLSNLAATVGLPKSSAFRYLAALEARGYVVRSDDGIGYRLGSPDRRRPAHRPGPAGAAGHRRQAVDGPSDQQRHPGLHVGQLRRSRHPLPVGRHRR